MIGRRALGGVPRAGRISGPSPNPNPRRARVPLWVLAGALLWTLPGAVRAAETPAPTASPSPSRIQGRAPLADAELAFTHGVLAFHDGDFETARAAFEEAVRLAPGDGRARQWLGVTLLDLDLPREAATALRASLDARRPPADRAEVRARLAEAERRARGEAGGSALVAAPGWGGDFAVLPEVPRFDGRLFLGVGADSNPNLLPDGLVLATPGGDPVAGAASDTVALADARLAVQAVDAEAGHSLGLVLHGAQSLHDTFGYLDLRRLGGVAQLALGKDPLGYATGPLGYARVPFGRSRWTWLLQAGWQTDSLDGHGFDDAFLAGTSLALEEPGAGSVGGRTWLGVSFVDRSFDGDPSGSLKDILGRSGTELRGELAQYLFLSRRDRYLRLAVAAGRRDAGAAFDASSLEGSGELSLPLAALGAPRWTVYATGAYRRDEYDHAVSNLFAPTADPRQDREIRVGGSVVFRAVADLFVSGRVTWIDHRIDTPAGFAAPDLSYDRTLATLGLSWVF